MTSTEEPVYIYFVGTAGSGKSTLVGAFKEWCTKNQISTTVLNLDPGVNELPYTPDVDIREWVNIKDIMEDHHLGPNGAQIAAADMLALHAPSVQRVLEDYREDYILVDTPGQIELFAFRAASKTIMKTFSPEKAMMMYLFDPNLARSPSGFISSLMLWATVTSRFPVPSVGVLAKSDMMDTTYLDKLASWTDDIFHLYNDATAQEQDMNTVLNVELLKALESLGVTKRIFPVSAFEFEGMEDMYNEIQQIYAGGQDLGHDA